MPRSTFAALFGHRRFALALFVMGVAPSALAQRQPQLLTVGFNFVATSAVPLADWSTAGVAALLALAALIVLRRRGGRGRQLLGFMLALGAGATLLAGTGQRPISDAMATAPAPAIGLTVSPGTLDVSPYFATSPLAVIVTNTTGQPVQINSIALGAGAYFLVTPQPASTPPACVVAASILPPGGACTVTLQVLQEG